MRSSTCLIPTLLFGKHVTEIDLAGLETDPTAVSHDRAPIVERILELLQPVIRAR